MPARAPRVVAVAVASCQAVASLRPAGRIGWEELTLGAAAAAAAVAKIAEKLWVKLTIPQQTAIALASEERERDAKVAAVIHPYTSAMAETHRLRQTAASAALLRHRGAAADAFVAVVASAYRLTWEEGRKAATPPPHPISHNHTAAVHKRRRHRRERVRTAGMEAWERDAWPPRVGRRRVDYHADASAIAQ